MTQLGSFLSSSHERCNNAKASSHVSAALVDCSYFQCRTRFTLSSSSVLLLAARSLETATHSSQRQLTDGQGRAKNHHKNQQEELHVLLVLSWIHRLLTIFVRRFAFYFRALHRRGRGVHSPQTFHMGKGSSSSTLHFYFYNYSNRSMACC